MRKPVQKSKSFLCLDALAFDVDHEDTEVCRHPKLAHLSPKEATRVYNKLVARHNGDADEMRHAKLPIIGWHIKEDENAKYGVFMKPVLRVPHRAKTASWKDARKTTKQWARHPKRALQNVKYLNRFDVLSLSDEVVKRRKDAHDRLVSDLVHSDYKHLTRLGGYYVYLAYDAARRDVEDLQRENDEKLAARGPTIYFVRQEYDSQRRRSFDDQSDLQYYQDLYEPRNLEDLGHQGMWNPSLPSGFNVITDASFDRYGDLSRPKLSLVSGFIDHMECFRMMAYANPNRDDAEMHSFRSEYYDDGFDGIYREFAEAA